MSTSNGKQTVVGRPLVIRIKQQCYKVCSLRKSTRRVKPVRKKAILYKHSLEYLRAEGKGLCDGSNQVILGGNTDNVWYKLTPKDCQSERVNNSCTISYTIANMVLSVATQLETVG